MTNDELRKSWKDYALVQPGNNPTVPLKDAFMICLGPMAGGLLFDTGGQQGAPAYILKPDDDDGCWVKTDWDAADDEAWQLIGQLVRLPEPDDEGEKKRPKRSKPRQRKRAGGR